MIFTGERGTVEIFLQTFNYFRNANHHNDVMHNPFERSNLLLTYMKGLKVQQWAARKGEELTIAVLGDPANNVATMHNVDDEQLWNTLTVDLRTPYLLCMDSEEWYVCSLYGYGSVGKWVPVLEPLTLMDLPTWNL